MKRSSRSAFTLIELLVVLVILLIMAGILFPVLAGARKKAYQVKCSSQLRQIGMAIQMYAADHDDMPPIGGYDKAPQVGTAAAVRVLWQDTIVQTAYLRGPELLVCPSARHSDPRHSYGVNRFVMGWFGSAKLDSIPYPAHTVLVTEKTGFDWPAWPPSEAQNPLYQPLDPRHNEQLNVLFADGHVKYVAVGQLIEGPILWRFLLN